MVMYRIFGFLLCLLLFSCRARRTNPSEILPVPAGPDAFKAAILSQDPGLDSFFQKADDYNISIRLTAGGKTWSYDAPHSHYFYPASTVKFPVALLALEKAARLNISLYDQMITDSACCRQQRVVNDPMSATGSPTLAGYIRRIFLISDNDAFNRLYEFCGQAWINDRLHQLGYSSARIVHRLGTSMSQEENRQTNPIQFLDSNAKLLVGIKADRSGYQWRSEPVALGQGYMAGGELIAQPFDFSNKNRLSLDDLHRMIRAVFDSAGGGLRIRPADLDYLKQCMREVPSQVREPDLSLTYPDGYLKFLFVGGEGRLPEGISIANKSGDAYGFLTDVTHITDSVHHLDYFLSAAISCNSDGIYNDDRYDYASAGLPFMKRLGLAVHEIMLNNHKQRE